MTPGLVPLIIGAIVFVILSICYLVNKVVCVINDGKRPQVVNKINYARHIYNGYQKGHN